MDGSEPAVGVEPDAGTVTSVARAATGAPELRVAGWHTTTVSGQGRRHIHRLAGTGRLDGAPRPWSVILKIIDEPADADVDDWDPRNWVYWEREYLLYRAGLPQSVAGPLRAPRCYGTAEPRPGERWIWLEDVTDRYGRRWSVDRHRLAARHLGEFNGAFLTGAPVPDLPCLGGERLRSRSADQVAALARISDPEVWADPRVRRAFPTPVLPRLERLLADRERFLSALGRLPQALCHLDVHVGNMAALENTDGTDGTVLFDWAIAGRAAPGQEIANLIWSAFLEFQVDVADAAELEAAVLDGYLEGLTEAGWHGEQDRVRAAYLTAAVLIFGLAPEAVDHARGEEHHAGMEAYYGWPIERMIDQAARVTWLLLERADALRGLLDGR